MIGTAALAEAIAVAAVNAHTGIELPAGVHHLASGQQRAVYLHEPTGTVYKIGDDACNRYEHQTLTKLRADGHAHAPETSIYEITTTDYELAALGVDSARTRTVIAMPYLPEDGSAPHNAETWLPGMVDLNPDNIHAHGGKLWLIDAGGL